MAKSDLPTDEGSTSRVFKSSQVHKRRVDSNQRAALRKAQESAQQAADEPADESVRPRREGRTRFTDLPVAPFEDEASPQPVEQPQAVPKPAEGDASEAPAQGEGEQRPAARFTVIHGTKSAPEGEGKPAVSAAANEGEPAQGDQEGPDAAEQDGAGAAESAEGDERKRPRVRRRTDRPRPSDAQAGEDQPENGQSDRPSARKRKPLSRPVRIALYITAGILAFVLVAFGVFAWNRWWRFNDAADFQGTWYADGTAIAVEVSDTTIQFTEDVAYGYEIDPGAKTIEFKFGPMEGKGRYWFTDDRKRLVIIDGPDYTAFGTFVEDVERALMDLARISSNNDIALPSGEGIIVLNRTATPPVTATTASGESASAASADAEEAGANDEDAAGEATEGEPTGEEPADETAE